MLTAVRCVRNIAGHDRKWIIDISYLFSVWQWWRCCHRFPLRIIIPA